MTRQPRILALDDDPTIHALFPIAFRSLPVHLILAGNEEEAQHCVGHTPPDLFLVDFQLHGKNGVEVAESILQRAGQRVPIIVVTAETKQPIDPYVHSGRILGYVRKPIALSTFGLDILRYLPISNAEIDPQPILPNSLSPDSLEVAFLKSALAKAHDFSLRGDRDLLRDGLLIQAAHQWAGVSGIECMPDMETAARSIEQLGRIASPGQIPSIRRHLAEIASKFEDALIVQVS